MASSMREPYPVPLRHAKGKSEKIRASPDIGGPLVGSGSGMCYIRATDERSGMADDSQHTPTYLPWTTFENVTEELRGKGLPRKLDRSVLKGKSGSTQAQYLAALRFMGMIDGEDRPTEF